MNPLIHPTAIVDPEAQLAPDVQIGPFALIGKGVSLGPGCVVMAHAVLEGVLQAGERNTFGYGCIIAAPPQDLSWQPSIQSGVIIGTHNIFREYCTIHRGAAQDSFTTVGNHNYLMAGAHLGHNCAIGSHIVIANNCMLGGYVQIGDRAFLGGGSGFHQHLRVGRLAITQGNGSFSKDLPPFCMAGQLNEIHGLNLVGLRRAGLDPEERADVKRAFDLLFLSGKNVSQALETFRATQSEWGPEAREFFEFAAQNSKRGLCSRLRDAAPAQDPE